MLLCITFHPVAAKYSARHLQSEVSALYNRYVAVLAIFSPGRHLYLKSLPQRSHR